MTVVVHAANVPDTIGGKAVLLEAEDDAPTLEQIWADQGYRGLDKSAPIVCGVNLEIVKRNEPGFQVLPRRWVVERTFGWLGRQRRLSKDYEQLPEVSEAVVYAAMIRLMLKRLTA